MVLRTESNCVVQERFRKKKYMVGKTDKLFSMIVKFNTDTTFQDFAKNT